MEYASAIYWGGDLISAADCDYESYRSTGTVCPFCNGAVFLRAGGMRKIKDREVAFRACFAHFNAGEESDSCEARSMSSEGRQELEAIRTAKKDQRLVLFNDRLWEAFCFAREQNTDAAERELKLIKRNLNVQSRARAVRQVLKVGKTQLLQRCIGQLETIASSEADTSFRDIMEEKYHPLPASTNRAQRTQDRVNKCREYFSHKANRASHIAICGEILDFLATPSGAYALERFLLFGFSYFDQFGSELLASGQVEGINLYAIKSTIYAQGIAQVINSTMWSEALKVPATKKGFCRR